MHGPAHLSAPGAQVPPVTTPPVTTPQVAAPPPSHLLATPPASIGGAMLCAALAAIFVLPLVVSDFWLSVLNYAGIAAVGAIGLNLLTGNAGQVSLGQPFFMGVGCYVAAFAGQQLGLPLPVWLVAAMLAGGLFMVLVDDVARTLSQSEIPLVILTSLIGAPVFAGLDAGALDDILSRAQTVRLSKGDLAFRQDQRADRFFLLLHGRLRVTRLNAEGGQVVVRFIAPNDLFGVGMAIGAATYPGTATAVVDSLALVWPNSAWTDLVAAYPSVAVEALQSLGARLQDTQERVLDLSTLNVEQRIAGAVLSLAAQAGRATEDGTLIDFPLSRQDLAELTGTTLHTVSRTLSAWEAKGLVVSGRRRITVRDGPGLEVIAGKN